MAAAEIEIKLSNGAKAGETLKELTKQANTLNKEIKDLKPGTDEFIKKAGDLQKVNTKLTDVKTQIKGTTAASDQLKKSWGGILQQIPGFSQLSGVLGKAKGGVGGLTSSFGMLKGAIISTGIGALVLAIVALVSWFAKTEKGANMMAGAFKAFGAVVDTLMNKLWNIGTTLKELFSNPVQFFKNLGNDIANAAKEGYELVQVFDEIEDKQREQEVRAKEQEIQIERLLTQQKNVGKSYEERLAILAQVEKLTRDSYAEQLALSDEYLKAVDREVAAADKAGVLGDELLDKQKDAKLAYLDLVQQEGAIEDKVANAKEKLFDKQELLNDKALASKEKSAKALEDAAKEELAAAENILQLKASLIDEGMAKEIEKIKLDTQNKIAQAKGTTEQITQQKVLLEEISQKQIQDVKDKYAADALAKQKKADDDAAAARDAATQKDLNNIQSASDHKNFILLQALSEGQLTRQQFDELAEENQIAAWEEQLIALEEQGEKESQLYEQIAGKIINIELRKEAEIKKNREDTFKATVALGNAIFQSQLDNIARENAAAEKRLADIEQRNGKESAQYKQAQAQLLVIQRTNFEKKKKTEKAQIKINALAEIAGIIKGAVEVGGIYGVILGAILSAATLVRANNAIKNVDAQQFKDGGIPDGVLHGPSHAQGGIPLVAEGEEIILTKGVYRNPRLRAAASEINVAGGGRKFATGGPTSPFQNRAAIPSTASANQVNQAQQNGIETKLDTLIGVVNQWPTRLKVINVVTETDDGIKTVNKIKDDANV